MKTFEEFLIEKSLYGFNSRGGLSPAKLFVKSHKSNMKPSLIKPFMFHKKRQKSQTIN